MKRARSLPLAAMLFLGLTACSGGVDNGSPSHLTSTAQTSSPQTTQGPNPSTPTPTQGITTQTQSSTDMVTTTSTPPPSLQSAFESVESGVVRFDVSECKAAAVGSGFAISPTLVVTAAHVVQDGQVIRLIQGTTAVGGTVIGLDQGADVALVRTAIPLTGRTLTFSDTPPRIGDQVGAIGFPEGDPLTFNIGTVSGLNRKTIIAGVLRHDLIEFDADSNLGSSGGPVIDTTGRVVGLVDAQPANDEPGRRLAVSASTAQPLVAAWEVSPQTVTPPNCSTVLAPDGTQLPSSEFPGSTSRQALSTLGIYFNAINTGDYPTALSQLTHQGGLTAFKDAVTSSDDSSFAVNSITDVAGSPVVWLSFVSNQDPGRGPSDRPQETCTMWSMDYVFAKKNGLWLIDSTRQHADVPEDLPCHAE